MPFHFNATCEGIFVLHLHFALCCFLLLQLYGQYTDQITDFAEKEAAKLLDTNQAQKNNERPLKRESQVEIKEERYSKCQGRNDLSLLTL